MNADRWKYVQEIFEGALAMPEAERDGYIRQKCTGDLELYEEVMSLVREDSNIHDLLEGMAVDAIDLDEMLSLEGKRFGPYLLHSRLGAGGMGTVYKAERVDGQFQQQIALKVIKPGLSSADILKRFRAERQILARLQHPAIARLIDGGVSKEGIPFFTMEFIDGKPLRQYCDENQLSVKDRLKLFQQICEGVSYAHQNLVIHRDLKPDNILVQPDGNVKLLDFGIARVINPDSQLNDLFTPLTRTGLRVMTPEYASPEQVLGDPVSTASDIYSLGVILYELLTGRRPFYPGSRPGEVERLIVETEATRPSTLIRKLKNNGATSEEAPLNLDLICISRKTTADKLSRFLRGDIDNICLKALQKEPERRYQSVLQFSEDLQRFIDGQPVLARPDSVSYRAGKFVRRHRSGVLTTLAVLIAIIGLVVYYTGQLADERDNARLQAHKAGQVSEFLKGIFTLSDPYNSSGKDITARELLDSGAEKIGRELAGQPQLQAELISVIGGVYRGIGLFERADSLYRQSLNIRQQLFDNQHPLLAESYFELGGTAYEIGDYRRADSLNRIAYNIRRKIFGMQHPETAASLNNLALFANIRGEQDSAKAFYLQALNIYRESYGDNHIQVANTRHFLATVLRHQGQFQEAEVLYRQALSTRRQLLDSMHIDIAYSLNHLGRLLYQQDKYQEALPLLREGLAIRRQVYKDRHPEVMASLGALAANLLELKQYDEAESLYRKALEIAGELFEGDHPYISGLQGSLGNALLVRGEYSEALKYSQSALAIGLRLFNPDHVFVAARQISLAKVQLAMGNPQKAAANLQQALEIRRKHYPPGDLRVAQASRLLGECLTDLKEFEKAEPLLTTAYQTYLDIQGSEHSETREARQKLLQFYEKTGNQERAAILRNAGD